MNSFSREIVAFYGLLIFRCDLSMDEIRKMIEIMVCDLYNSITYIPKNMVFCLFSILLRKLQQTIKVTEALH